MAVSLALVALFVAGAAVTAGIASFLSRPIPRAALGAFALVAVLPFPTAFVTDTTILPLDHVGYTTPWVLRGFPPPHNPYLNDIATQILPWAKAARMALKERELPWRDRWNGCGMALAANSVSAAFSPWTLLALPLPMARGYTLVAALKLLLAAAGMFLWVRELGASARSAVFAGTVFALSFSFTPPWLLFPQSVEIALWPWVLFFAERLIDERRRERVIAALALLFAVMVLAGHPETAVIGFVFAGLWLVIRALARDLPHPGRVFGALAFSAAVAIGLTAFLLVPSLYAIAGSGRLADAQKPYWEPHLALAPHAPVWRMAPTSLFPHTLGNAIVSPTLPFSYASFPENTLGHFGIVGWAAALLFFRPGSRRSVREWTLFALIVAGWGSSVGLWPFAEIFSVTPGLKYLFPVRLHSWEALGGSALAALELDRLVRDARERRVSVAAAIAVPAALAALAVAVYLAFRGEHAAAEGLGPQFQARRLAVALFVLALTAMLLALARRRPQAAILALTALAAGELLYQWRLLFRLSQPERLFPETRLISFLKTRPGPFRVVGVNTALFPSTNVFAGVEDIRTHDAVERHDYLEFLDRTAGYAYEYFKRIRDVDASSLDFLNVRYAVAAPGTPSPGSRWRLAYEDPDGRVFENTGALERAFVPGTVRRVASEARADAPLSNANAAFGENAFRNIVANTDWRGRAWILGDGEGETSGGSAEISDYDETTNSAAFRARVTAAPAYVVVSLVQDGGWSAEDHHGEKLPLLRANGPFMAIKLPEGETRVRLRYRPPGSGAAAIAGLTGSLLLCAAGVAVSRRRRARAV
jgi:hypothetical protein